MVLFRNGMVLRSYCHILLCSCSRADNVYTDTNKCGTVAAYMRSMTMKVVIFKQQQQQLIQVRRTAHSQNAKCVSNNDEIKAKKSK